LPIFTYFRRPDAGEELVLFGVIRNANQPPYDAVVTVVGPRAQISIRQKGSGFGAMNRRWVTFTKFPGFLTVGSNRPLRDISGEIERETSGWLLQHKTLGQYEGLSDPQRELLIDALIRQKKGQGVYRQSGTAVTFLTPEVFRAAIPIPAASPQGSYAVEVELFKEGKLAPSG
jgi:uncharacterized protein (TIGR02186 family)